MDKAAIVLRGIVQTATNIDFQTSRMIAYSRNQLMGLRKNKAAAALRGTHIPALVKNGLFTFRGTRGGTGKQRPISVQWSPRLPLTTHRRPRPPQVIVPLRQVQLPRTTASGLHSSIVGQPTLYLLNANSIVKPHAIDHLAVELSGYNADIGVISESHLKKKHADSEVFIEGYTVARRDRLNRRGGGVAIFVKTEHQVISIDPLNDDRDYELMWKKIITHNQTIILGAIYHPPKPIYSTSKLIDHIDEVVEAFQTTSPHIPIILAGDVNSLDITQITERTGMIGIVKAPTRGPNTLDQILVSHLLYDNVKVVRSVGKSDHSAVIAYTGEIITAVAKANVSTQFRHRCPAKNHACFLSAASSLPSSYFIPQEPTLQASADHFYTQALTLLNQYYPLRAITTTSTDPYYMTPEIKQALRHKNKLMHLGRVEEAGAVAEKIQTLVIR